jgi:glutathione synthase
MLKLAEAIRPKLVQDGLFMVGLDIVGDKLMEINIFSPGGLISAGRAVGTDFYPVVIEALERKLHYRKIYRSNLPNKVLATLD